jgi:hypothetical protein
VGISSNDIEITLERSVPYTITITPYCPNFEFTPNVIVFTPADKTTKTFKIMPLTTTAGTYTILWSKVEEQQPDRFSEIADSFFKLVSTAAFKQYKLLIGATVSRTALKSTSLPIQLTLTSPPATEMVVILNSTRPYQPDYIEFDPPQVVFKPGMTALTFRYITKVGAVSGLISFAISGTLKDIYYMPANIMNFEILDIDTEPPAVLNYYIVDLGRTYMYFRISTSESVWAKSLLTLKGTLKPSLKEIDDPKIRGNTESKTDVLEMFVKNTSNQSTVTTTYIYHDVYLYFTDLEEHTDYMLYFFLTDLSGNNIEPIAFPFSTRCKTIIFFNLSQTYSFSYPSEISSR